MSASLRITPDDDLVRVSSPSPADADWAGFGALLTGRGSLPLESMDVFARIDGLLSRVTVRRAFVNAQWGPRCLWPPSASAAKSTSATREAKFMPWEWSFTRS